MSVYLALHSEPAAGEGNQGELCLILYDSFFNILFQFVH